MASSLSNPVNTLSEGIHKIKSKYENDDKKSEINIATAIYTDFKDYLIEYKCLCCNKNYQ